MRRLRNRHNNLRRTQRTRKMTSSTATAKPKPVTQPLTEAAARALSVALNTARTIASRTYRASRYAVTRAKALRGSNPRAASRRSQDLGTSAMGRASIIGGGTSRNESGDCNAWFSLRDCVSHAEHLGYNRSELSGEFIGLATLSLGIPPCCCQGPAEQQGR